MKKKVEYQDLQVFLTEFKIDLFRYDAYVRSVVLRNLNDAQKMILAQVAGEDLSKLGKRDINRLLKRIETIIDDEYERINKFMDKTGQELLVTTHQVEAFAYNEWLGAKLFDSLPKYKLEAIKATPLFEGRALGDWWGKQQSDLKFNLETIIRNSALIGDSEYNAMREIRDRFEITGRNSATLVRTGNASIANQAQVLLLEANEDIVKYKQHLSTLDSRTSLICKFRDGMKWKIDGTPVGHSEPFIQPPLHPNCRSIIIMLVNEDHPTTRASEFGQVDGSMNYADFLRDQSDSYQNKVLGKQRAQWFRDDKLDFRKMLNQEDRPMTIEQLRKKYNL